jgi:hypothetical protein
LGKIEFEDHPISFDDPNIRNLIAQVSITVGTIKFNLGLEINNKILINYVI